MVADSPLVYGLNVKSLARSVQQAVQVSMDAADRALELRKKNQPAPRPIPPGSCVYIKREMLSDPKSKSEKWIGPLRLIASNEYVCLVEDAKGARDIVHREHTCHASKRLDNLKFIEEFESEFIFPHLTANVKSKVRQSDQQLQFSPEKSARLGLSSQGERCSTPVKRRQVQTTNPDISPVRITQPGPATNDHDTTVRSTETVVSDGSADKNASSTQSEMEIGVPGGTLFETAIAESDLAENSSIKSRDAATLDSTPLNVASPKRPTPVKQKRTQQRKRPRDPQSPNSTIVEIQSKAPRKSSRPKTQVQPMNIKSSRSKSYN